jgi:general secretion pathway protein I
MTKRDASAGPGGRGFTLLEVLMAIAVFALAAIVLAGAYTNVLIAYNVVNQGNQADADLAFARSIILTEPDITKLQQGGDFDTADNRHGRWTVDIQPTTTADLFTVALTCELTNPAGGDPQKTVDNFMLLRPTWSIDPAARSQLREDARKRITDQQGKKNS